MSDNEYWQRYAPPLDVLLDLDELGERHGLRKRTLEWIERVRVPLTDAPLEEPVQQAMATDRVRVALTDAPLEEPVQQAMVKDRVRYG